MVTPFFVLCCQHKHTWWSSVLGLAGYAYGHVKSIIIIRWPLLQLSLHSPQSVSELSEWVCTLLSGLLLLSLVGWLAAAGWFVRTLFCRTFFFTTRKIIKQVNGEECCSPSYNYASPSRQPRDESWPSPSQSARCTADESVGGQSLVQSFNSQNHVISTIGIFAILRFPWGGRDYATRDTIVTMKGDRVPVTVSPD